ncbi:murein L,D-transpeptidase family protein [Pseudorhodobacter sp. W20_MBD10_FR17]|uniref:L,D-transpeptidase family protein n=1 Tax=Pseudorhodobacter sp. W20_MBD10_FR17 TaxID=3240266 RepID=UPI003F943660
MRRLAGAFSALVLMVVCAAVALVIVMRPPPVVTVLPPLTGAIDRIVVQKSARRMMLFQDSSVVREYRIALGFAPLGAKDRQGDGRTPEGLFKIDRRNAESAYHLSLGINYPRAQDLARAAKGGYSPGGDIFFHGQPNAWPDGAVVAGDWTAGCMALTDAEMREIWDFVPIGTAVEILP